MITYDFARKARFPLGGLEISHSATSDDKELLNNRETPRSPSIGRSLFGRRNAILKRNAAYGVLDRWRQTVNGKSGWPLTTLSPPDRAHCWTVIAQIVGQSSGSPGKNSIDVGFRRQWKYAVVAWVVCSVVLTLMRI